MPGGPCPLLASEAWAPRVTPPRPGSPEPPLRSSSSLLSWLSAVEPAISAPAGSPSTHGPMSSCGIPGSLAFPLFSSILTPSSHQHCVVSLFWDKSPIKQPSCRTGNSWGGAVWPGGQLGAAGGGAPRPPGPASCQLSGGTQLLPDNTSAGGWECALPPPLPSVVKTALISLFCSTPLPPPVHTPHPN